MAQLKFVAKVITVGKSEGVIIPKAIVRLLEKGKRYVFTIVETEEGFEV